MAITGEETENLTNRDIKFLIGSFTMITLATVFGLYIYNDLLGMHWSRRTSPYEMMSVWKPLSDDEVRNIKNITSITSI